MRLRINSSYVNRIEESNCGRRQRLIALGRSCPVGDRSFRRSSPNSCRFSAVYIVAARFARVGDAKKQKPDEINHRAFSSGDVLLSHNLSPHYHRGCSVSLPCSEWERVGPLRYDHQRSEPRLDAVLLAALRRRSADLWQTIVTIHILKELLIL